MDINFNPARTWVYEQHLRNINDGEWVPMLDPDGNALLGITGKRGVRGIKKDGTHIGADFIRMQPGSAFPLHEHDGEHEIYFIKGQGFVHINGRDISVRAGDVVHIPGEYAHGVGAAPDSELIFVAAGHPHKHVDTKERMRYAKEEPSS